MIKPKKRSRKSHYDYNEISDYIEKKYNIELRGYKKKKDGIYRDFWHWLLQRNEIHNGCYIYLIPEDIDYDQVIKDEDYIGIPKSKWDGDYAPPWCIEICQLFIKEFPELLESDVEVYVEW